MIKLNCENIVSDDIMITKEKIKDLIISNIEHLNNANIVTSQPISIYLSMLPQFISGFKSNLLIDKFKDIKYVMQIGKLFDCDVYTSPCLSKYDIYIFEE